MEAVLAIISVVMTAAAACYICGMRANLEPALRRELCRAQNLTWRIDPLRPLRIFIRFRQRWSSTVRAFGCCSTAELGLIP